MRYTILLTLALFLLGCSERTERIENKLNAYVQEDLKFIVAQTIHASGDRSGILDTPYYRVKDFRLFAGDTAAVYSAYAEVDFFIYQDIQMHEKRKYRYNAHARQWDRYYKALKYGQDSLERTATAK
ncbi:hypothetical protein [Fibrobacter sp. UWR2]|uniref:hypothetical protein n=1 Tax=Fibrobacter sp. UWR2 TaxID=1964352 RepID=UPI000B522BF9|nr:hypothetical protein [Fibrobacter sp. UWR2]OWV00848.1 hypothetical protein B7994_06395 [Fibrobacter sp. UWR2]